LAALAQPAKFRTIRDAEAVLNLQQWRVTGALTIGRGSGVIRGVLM
jgi:hypothetical protein